MKILLPILLLCLTTSIYAQEVETFIDSPSGDDMHYYEGYIFSTDYGGTVIRKISSDGKVEEILKGYSKLGAIELDESGNIYVCSYDFGLLLKIGNNGKVDTLITGMKGPSGITSDTKGNLYINQNAVGIITKYKPESGEISPLYQGQPLYWNTAITIDSEGSIYSNNMWTGEIIKITSAGDAQIVAELIAIMDSEPDLGYMEFINGNILALHLGNNVLYSVNPETGFYKVVLGIEGEPGHKDGKFNEALLEDPVGIVLNDNNSELYITDGKEGDQRLRRVIIGENGKFLPDFANNQIQRFEIKKNEQDKINFEIASKENTTVKYELRNAMSELIKTEKITINAGDNSHQINVESLNSGVYFITLITRNDFAKTYKFKV